MRMEKTPTNNKPEQPVAVKNPESSLENVRPDDRISVEIMGEERFNRLQELGAALASGKDLGDKERKEYADLKNEFMAALETSTRNSRERRDLNDRELARIKNDLNRQFKNKNTSGGNRY